MNPDFIRQTVNTAGTILVNSRTTFHFELNGKTSEQCRHLEMVLQYLASVSGSKMYQGIAHPLTQSPGTLSLEVNISANNPQRKVAERVVNGLYSSANCYVYEVPAPQPAFMRAVNASDYQLEAEFLGKCRRVLPNPQGGFKWGLTLSEEIEDACALTAHFPNSLFSDDAAVADTVYNGDAPKAHAVMLHMRRVATHYGGTYSHEQIGRTAEGGPLYGHVLRGYNPVDCLRKRKGHPELNLIEDRADAIRRDVATLSPGIDIPPASLQIKPSDGSQQGGYWANDGSGRRTQDQFLGIDLFGGRSPG